MENKKKKCLHKDHKEIDAISYCQECKIYLCNKCSNYHQALYENHHHYNLDKESKQIFVDICKEEKHPMKLEYFCKNHNQLCCVACIAKIKGHGNGQHKDCEICLNEDIKEEKKNKLKENIEQLEELYNNLDSTIKNINLLFESINEKKEKLKLNIQQIFTKIRNSLNEREDEILIEIDKQFNNYYSLNEDIIRENNKLPNKIKKSLEKGKKIEKEWNDNNLNSMINDCIVIENNIKEIKIINYNLKKFNSINELKIIKTPDEEIDNIYKKIKQFGRVLINFETKILNKENDQEKFFKLISENVKINNIKLIYRSSEDGFNYLNIVNKINNKSNLIILYLTNNTRIFGAYIKTKLENIDLNGSTKYYKDEQAFVFSLNNNKIYKILEPNNAIGFDKKFFILIGNNWNWNGFFYNDNIIYDKTLINKPKIYDFVENCELTDGNGQLTELEIFELNNN